MPGRLGQPAVGQAENHRCEQETGPAAQHRRHVGPADGPGAGTQAQGVPAKPNNGKPENQLPYTPFGLELYRSHKALEGIDAVLPSEDNDPRNRCEPLGMPRSNHYNVRLTQIFQDEYKIAILYHYDNRWRIIWTDGRQLPKVVPEGVEIGGEVRERRFFGYSVGRWVDDNTLEVQTVGMMPDDRVWLDSTGRPISDQVRVTETFRRVTMTGWSGRRRSTTRRCIHVRGRR